MPGPLPEENRARKNAPTIPTTQLPVSGRQEPIPDIPEWIELGRAGRAWWNWAWKTPQACAWGPGQEVIIARRAILEDAFHAADPESARHVALCREMREIEDRLGLTPKGLAALRWKIVSDSVEPTQTAESAAGVTDIASRRARLTS